MYFNSFSPVGGAVWKDNVILGEEALLEKALEADFQSLFS